MMTTMKTMTILTISLAIVGTSPISGHPSLAISPPSHLDEDDDDDDDDGDDDDEYYDDDDDETNDDTDGEYDDDWHDYFGMKIM